MTDHTKRAVSDLYIKVLNGNFLQLEGAEKTNFVNSTKAALKSVTSNDIKELYHAIGWRENLVASWLAGLSRNEVFLSEIERLLIPSRTTFAGQMHCFACARFGSVRAAEVLVKYLRTYLPVGENQFDQLWAIGALHFVDKKLNKKMALPFLNDTSIWFSKYAQQQLNPFEGIKHFDDIMKFVQENFA